MLFRSYHGYKFIINFLDDYSSYTYSELLKTKDAAFVAFKKFKALTEKKTGKKIKQFCIDQGGEFLNGEFKHFLNVEGILVHPSAPHMHQQNGRAERLNRTLIDKEHYTIWLAFLSLGGNLLTKQLSSSTTAHL